MIITKFGITYEQPSFDKAGNVYFRAQESRKNIERLIINAGVNGFIEPNIAQTGVMLDVDTIDIAQALNPWNADYTKCDALHVSKEFLKDNKFALFGRSADCMMLSLISEKDVYLLHLSAESINNGILEHLKAIDTRKRYFAIEGPCISAKEFFIYGEKYIERKTGNYCKLGYISKTYLDDRGLHVSIRGIVRSVLSEIGISLVLQDNRCTYTNNRLGSNRRQGINRHDNITIIK